MNLRIKILAFVLATVGLGVNAQTTFEEISADMNKAGGVYLAYPKVEAKQLCCSNFNTASHLMSNRSYGVFRSRSSSKLYILIK